MLQSHTFRVTLHIQLSPTKNAKIDTEKNHLLSLLFQVMALSPSLILDIDECNRLGLPSDYQHLAHSCHDDAKCTNTNGSYYCKCLLGYSGNGKQCDGRSRLKRHRSARDSVVKGLLS